MDASAVHQVPCCTAHALVSACERTYLPHLAQLYPYASPLSRLKSMRNIARPGEEGMGESGETRENSEATRREDTSGVADGIFRGDSAIVSSAGLCLKSEGHVFIFTGASKHSLK